MSEQPGSTGQPPEGPQQPGHGPFRPPSRGEKGPNLSPVPRAGYGYPGALPSKADGSAVGALLSGVFSILLVVLCCLPFPGVRPIVAILVGGAGVFLGVLSRRKVAAAQGSLGGGGLAVGGMITGSIGVVLGAVQVMLVLASGTLELARY
jgi:hypothetical protein